MSNSKTAYPNSYTTWDGKNLSPAEAKFIDKYIELSNGRKAVIEAYPNRNPNTAAQYANVLLKKDYIASEINYRLEELRKESIAEADEIMQYFTSVMRGEVKDQFGLEAPLAERTKAAQELAKRKIDIMQRLAATGGEQSHEVRIVLDWSRPNEEQKT